MDLQAGIDLMGNEEFNKASKEYFKQTNFNIDPIRRGFQNADYIFRLRRLYFNPIPKFTEAILKDEQASMAYFYRGLCFLSGPISWMGDFGRTIDIAMSNFNASIILDRKNPLPYFGRAKAWFYTGEYHESLDDVEMAIDLDTGSSHGMDYREFHSILKRTIEGSVKI